MTTVSHAIKTLSAPILQRAALESFIKLDPRRAVEEPGDVRGLDRQRADDAAVDPGRVLRRRGNGICQYSYSP